MIALLACARPPVEAQAVFRPSTVTYVEHVSPGGMPDVTVEVTETTAPSDAPPPEGWEGPVFEATTAYADGRSGQVTRYVLAEQGLAYFATVAPDGAETRYAPKLALPAVVRRGDGWEGEHGDNHRACEAERTPFCRGGVATACVTTWADRATWMRQHWCPEVGWVGFELVTTSADTGVPIVFWSTDAARDGVALPDVPLDRRPVVMPSP